MRVEFCVITAAVTLSTGILSPMTLRAQTTQPSLPTIPGQPGFSPPLGTPKRDKSAEQLVRMKAVADVASIRPGQKFNLAFIFEIEPGWHIYWKNPGDSGGPTEIRVRTPHGFAADTTLFPRPVVFYDAVGVNYGYADRVALFVPVTAPPDLAAGQASFTADVQFLVCKEICLMGRQTAVVNVMTGRPSPASPVEMPLDSAITTSRSRLPLNLEDNDGAAVNFEDGTLRIQVPAKDYTDFELFPIDSPGVRYGVPTSEIRDTMMTISVEVDVNPNNSRGQALVLAGLVGLGASPDDPCYEFQLPLPGT